MTTKMFLFSAALLASVLAVASLPSSLAQPPLNYTELGDASVLFSGPLEVFAEDPSFKWCESPLWSEDGKFLLWSDVKWADEDGVTCGMIYKWDETTQTLSKFIPCSGLIGPGEVRDDISSLVEAGGNGLYWGWNGTKDLIICQHGKSRIVRINIDDVDENGEIDPSLVTVLVDSYNGTALNSPNDVTMHGEELYFTDPPFGVQTSTGLAGAFEDLSQDIGVYVIRGDPGPNISVEPERIINFGDPGPDAPAAPNGIALNKKGDIFVAITDFEDPRFHVYRVNGAELNLDALVLKSNYAINNNTQGFPDLNDGVTYSPGLDIFFGVGPGGIYIYNGTTFELLGFLRVDDLVANNVLGGGYLWLAANQRILRIPLSEFAAALTAWEEQGVTGPTRTSTTPETPSSAHQISLTCLYLVAGSIFVAFVI